MCNYIRVVELQRSLGFDMFVNRVHRILEINFWSLRRAKHITNYTAENQIDKLYIIRKFIKTSKHLAVLNSDRTILTSKIFNHSIAL